MVAENWLGGTNPIWRPSENCALGTTFLRFLKRLGNINNLGNTGQALLQIPNTSKPDEELLTFAINSKISQQEYSIRKNIIQPLKKCF